MSELPDLLPVEEGRLPTLLHAGSVVAAAGVAFVLGGSALLVATIVLASSAGVVAVECAVLASQRRPYRYRYGRAERYRHGRATRPTWRLALYVLAIASNVVFAVVVALVFA